MKQIWFFIVFFLSAIACKELPLPSPTPTPIPSPSATVAPSPTPTATPSPTATPWACTLPVMPNCAANTPNCCKEGGTKKYHPMIQAAQIELEKKRHDMFLADGSLAVSDVEYTTELAKQFQELHKICAVGGANDPLSKDEIGIKETNAQAVHIDVIIGGSNKPWTGGVYTCTPSAF